MGISKIKNEDGVIHILSCSNVVPVKRVSLILKSLLLFLTVLFNGHTSEEEKDSMLYNNSSNNYQPI